MLELSQIWRATFFFSKPNNFVEWPRKFEKKRAQITLFHKGTNGDLYMSEREITCDKGLWFKDLNTNVRKISCGRDGTWSITDGPLVTCTPVYCDTETIKPESAFILPGEISTNHYGTKVFLLLLLMAGLGDMIRFSVFVRFNYGWPMPNYSLNMPVVLSWLSFFCGNCVSVLYC